MIRMIGKMKKNAGWLVLVLALLFLQAFCDLSLPDYTSRIVDTGIQQKGIEDAVPDTIREEALGALLKAAGEKDARLIGDSYEKEGGLRRVRDLSRDERKELSGRMAEAELILMFAGQQGVDLTAMDAAAIDQMRGQLEEKLKEYPDTIVDQAAVSYVQQEYKAQGVDLDRLQRSYMLSIGARMIGLALIGMLAAILITFLSSRIAAALARDLRQEVYRKVLSFSASEMNKFSTASLITRSTNDIQQVQMVSTLMFRIVVFAPVMATGAIIKVARTGSYLKWILAVAVACVALLMIAVFALTMPKFKVLQGKIDRINLVAREMLTGVPVIRAFTTEKYEEERFDKANTDFMRTNLYVNRLMAVMMPVMMLIMNGVMVLTVYSGAKGIDLGKLQVGDMMAFMQYAMHVIISFVLITSIAIFMPRASVAAERIFAVLDSETDIISPESPARPEPGQEGLLQFRDVSFVYPGAEEKVLDHISFTAKKGETVAFVGSTGSGKSTLVNLIPRFYDVTEGSILVDGVDVREMDLGDLRARIGYVPQKAVLFSGTVESNMRFGREDAGEEEIRQAIDIAQASDFVYENEEGTKAPIAQGGSNVSGGQKQRLAIARAIVKNPEFYIFDDSFSALDFKTDQKLRSRLREECAGVTTLIVAQRISTIMHADQILVLHEGNVVGQGTHDELMESCKAYRQIADLQLQLGGESA
ncbi:MAG: ABC transporter ATP-binding protein [Lachnospiraceae bacterium]|nr:ABC transporter ATP-binding protein [Lachnospiraceae bacterium]